MGSNQPVLVLAWVRLTKPVLLTTTIWVVPLVVLALAAVTPVSPLPSPIKCVALMVPLDFQCCGWGLWGTAGPNVT